MRGGKDAQSLTAAEPTAQVEMHDRETASLYWQDRSDQVIGNPAPVQSPKWSSLHSAARVQMFHRAPAHKKTDGGVPPEYVTAAFVRSAAAGLRYSNSRSTRSTRTRWTLP